MAKRPERLSKSKSAGSELRERPKEGRVIEKPRLSYSRLSTFQGCRRRYYWTYIENLAPIDKADYFQVGLAVHELRELWVKGELKVEDISCLKQKIQEAHPENDAELTEMVSHQAAVLFNGYVQNFEESDFRLVSPEMHIEKDMGEFILYTRLDGLAIDEHEQYYADELKTTSRIDSVYLQGLRKGLQTGIRYWLMDEVLDFSIHGTLFEIIVKTKIPQYHRQPVLRDKWSIDYTKECVYGVWEEIKRCGNDKKLFYPSMNCSFGRFVCPYETLCREDTPMKRKHFFKEYRPLGKEDKRNNDSNND